MAGEGCNEEANRWAVMFNDALQAMLQQFQLEFPDTTNNYFDTYTILQNILQNPSAFGTLYTLHISFLIYIHTHTQNNARAL